MVCLWHLEQKVIFVKVEQALIPHFSKLQRQPAALHAGGGSEDAAEALTNRNAAAESNISAAALY